MNKVRLRSAFAALMAKRDAAQTRRPEARATLGMPARRDWRSNAPRSGDSKREVPGSRSQANPLRMAAQSRHESVSRDELRAWRNVVLGGCGVKDRWSALVRISPRLPAFFFGRFFLSLNFGVAGSISAGCGRGVQDGFAFQKL